MLAADCICLGGEASPPVAWLAAAFAPKEDFEFSEPIELVRAIERTLLGRCGIFCTTQPMAPLSRRLDSYLPNAIQICTKHTPFAHQLLDLKVLLQHKQYTLDHCVASIGIYHRILMP